MTTGTIFNKALEHTVDLAAVLHASWVTTGTIFNKALELLTPEGADAIIGERTPEHDLLTEGAQDAITSVYVLLCNRGGLRNNKRNQEVIAKAGLIVMQLVHIAYALGMARGRAQDTSGSAT